MPRTGTHTIRRALASHLGADDWEQENLFTAKRLPIAELAAKNHGHLSAAELRPHVPDEVWDGYFKFAFVRNPFDRFISTCFFLNRKDPGFPAAALPRMKQALRNPGFTQRILVAPQHRMLDNAGGDPAMDFTGHYESLQRDFETVCTRIGIEPMVLPIENRSDRGAYADYYDAELEQAVAALYAGDIERYGYRFSR